MRVGACHGAPASDHHPGSGQGVRWAAWPSADHTASVETECPLPSCGPDSNSRNCPEHLSWVSGKTASLEDKDKKGFHSASLEPFKECVPCLCVLDTLTGSGTPPADVAPQALGLPCLTRRVWFRGSCRGPSACLELIRRRHPHPDCHHPGRRNPATRQGEAQVFACWACDLMQGTKPWLAPGMRLRLFMAARCRFYQNRWPSAGYWV